MLYDFLTGPGLVLSLLVFFGGLIWRGVWYIKGLDWQVDRVAYRPHLRMGLRGAAQSIYRWLLPFGTYGWRAAPFFTLCTFVFHLGVIFVPLFLIGHSVMLQSAIGISLPTMPQGLADGMTIATLVAGGFIIVRRLALPEVRLLSTRRDYGVLALVLVPFFTGFLAVCNAPGYDFWLTIHMLSGEIMLVAAPFTKLSHIVLFFMSRGQLGMDYSIKRGGRYRGPCFPW